MTQQSARQPPAPPGVFLRGREIGQAVSRYKPIAKVYPAIFCGQIRQMSKLSPGVWALHAQDRRLCSREFRAQGDEGRSSTRTRFKFPKSWRTARAKTGYEQYSAVAFAVSSYGGQRVANAAARICVDARFSKKEMKGPQSSDRGAYGTSLAGSRCISLHTISFQPLTVYTEIPWRSWGTPGEA